MDEDAQRTGVITVDGIDYAVGLFWQTAEDPKVVKREAKLAAKQEVDPADLFVMRQGFVAQWAIGWTSHGHDKDMPAAAACLADALSDNWLGVFKVDNGWWFAASRRDAIMPDGDIFYDNEDDPRTRFETEFVRGGWDRVFTPDEWGMGGDTTPLEELLAGHDEPKLAYLNDAFARLPASVKIAGGLGIVGVLVLGYIGFQIFQGIQAEERARAEAAAREARERLRAEAEAARLEAERLANLKPADLVDRLWEREPRPAAWISECAAALDFISVEVPGWTMLDMSCSGDRASASWERGAGGTIQSARYGLRDVVEPRIDAAGDGMRVQVNFASNLEDRGQDTGLKLPVVRDRLLELFQTIDEPVRIQSVARPPMPPDENPENPRRRPPAHFVVSFSDDVPPLAWAPVLESFPGLVMDSVSFQIGQTQWSYNFRIYEELTDEELADDDAGASG